MVSRNNDSQPEIAQEDDDDNDEEEEQGGSNLLFSCQCDSARKVATLLSCLRRVVTVGSAAGSSSNFSPNRTSSSQAGGSGYYGATRSNTAAAKAVAGGSSNKVQHVTVYAGPDGLTFHVQHGLAKQSQCSVDMPKTMFRDYYVGEEEVWLEESDDDDDNDDGEGRDEMTNVGAGISQHHLQRKGGGRTKEIIHGGEFSVNLTTVLDCFSILSKTGSKPNSAGGGGSSRGGNNGTGGNKHPGGEYSSLSNVPLCMSYDRGTATLHLEFLEDGGKGASVGGCLVTCEVPGVAVADDVDDGPGQDEMYQNDSTTASTSNSGLATAFRSSPILIRAILSSDALQSAVSELYDVPGAKIVQISLSKKGLEFGTVGPRSEVWVNVPYHRGQGALYVGLESYKPDDEALTDDRNTMKRYPLGAFLSGMRGLDIGVETCISVNARGIMAIQHQVSKDEYFENGSNARPSFVDFIMTCIEDDEDDNNEYGGAEQQMRNKNGLHNITNTESLDREIEVGRKSHVTGTKSITNDTTSSTIVYSKSSSFEKDVRNDESDGHASIPERAPINRETATSRLLDELEVDSDLFSSNDKRIPVSQGRKVALEDIRRRRQERQQQRRPLDDRDKNNAQKSYDQGDEDDNDSDDDTHRRSSNDSRDERKRLAENLDARSCKSRRGNDGDGGSSDDAQDGSIGRVDFTVRHSTLAQDTQSQSEDEDGDETELEDALDVTADIPLLFSKRVSRGRRKNDDGDNSESEIEQEPRMMYGDTKLEFTQDSYDGD